VNWALIVATHLSVSQRTKALDIISGVEHRRRWRVGDKRQIVAETEQPGVNLLDVARRYDISRGLMWNWRQQASRGTLTAAVEPQFLSLRVLPEPNPPSSTASPMMSTEDKRYTVSARRGPPECDGVSRP
jgi:transposase-like protein